MVLIISVMVLGFFYSLMVIVVFSLVVDCVEYLLVGFVMILVLVFCNIGGVSVVIFLFCFDYLLG